MKVTDIVRGKNSTYQLQELLGKGGNAVVYRGVSMNTNTPVAIKKMVANDEVIIKQWRTEVDALIALRADKNDLVVQYLDHMNSGKNLLLVEEYAPGGTLQQLVRGTNGVKEPQVVTCLYRVTRGLEYIHSKNIVHRDLKGANVLLFDNNVVKLADFGLATPSPVTSVEGEDPSEDTENALLGSVYWMAPEVAKGEKHSFSSDIWALGCLCVELLTGNPPLFDRTPVNALYQLAEGKASPIPEGLAVSSECRAFLTSCLAKDPAQRPSAAELTKHPWFFNLRVIQRVADLKEKHQKRVAGVMGPEREMTATDVSLHNVAQWVESCLFSPDVASREKWIRTHLASVVTILPEVTPDESFSTIRSLAYAAQSFRPEDSCLFRELGETDLWEIKNLSELCRAEQLGNLFCGLTEKQEADVPAYTPTHPKALQTVLHLSDATAVTNCIDALHRLLVSATAPDSAPTPRDNVTREGSMRSFLEERKQSALHQLTAGGGWAAIRVFMETKCYSSLRDGVAPAVGWPTFDKLFHIICEVDETGNMNRLLWKHACLPPSAAGGDSASEASSVSGSEAEGGAEDSPTKGLWFLAMIEGGRHSCPHAAKLLVRFVNSSNSEAHTNMVNKAGVSLAGTLLLLASSSLLAAIRIEVVRTLPLLQRMSPRAAQFMRSPKDSLPLLARVLKRDGSHTILGEEILKNICTLCEEEKMATNAAQSAIFCRAVVRCLVNNWRNTTLFSLTRRLCELLYGHTAPTTAEFFPLDPSALQPTEQIPPELLAKV